MATMRTLQVFQDNSNTYTVRAILRAYTEANTIKHMIDNLDDMIVYWADASGVTVEYMISLLEASAG